MLLLTTDTLPDNIKIHAVLGMVEITHPIELGQKNLIRRLTETPENGHEKALEALQKSAEKAGANLVYGIRQSTAIGQFTNGTYLYMTYIGTAAQAEY